MNGSCTHFSKRKKQQKLPVKCDFRPYHREYRLLLHPPVQLIVCFFGLRLPYPLSGGFLLVLLLGLKGKWIFTRHNSLFFCKNKHFSQYFIIFASSIEIM
jgi:hypothetical protein